MFTAHFRRLGLIGLLVLTTAISGYSQDDPDPDISDSTDYDDVTAIESDTSPDASLPCPLLDLLIDGSDEAFESLVGELLATSEISDTYEALDWWPGAFDCTIYYDQPVEAWSYEAQLYRGQNWESADLAYRILRNDIQSCHPEIRFEEEGGEVNSTGSMTARLSNGVYILSRIMWLDDTKEFLVSLTIGQE